MEVKTGRPLNDSVVVSVPRKLFDTVMSTGELSDREKSSLLGVCLQAIAGEKPRLSRNSLAKYRLELSCLGLSELLALPAFRKWAR